MKFLNFYTRIKNIWNQILIENFFLDALIYVKFFSEF